MFMKALPLALLTFAVAGLACSSVDMTGIGVVTGGGAGTASGGAGGFGGTGGTGPRPVARAGASAGNGGSTGGGAGGSGGAGASGGNSAGAGGGGSDMASEPLPADVPGTLLSNGDGLRVGVRVQEQLLRRRRLLRHRLPGHLPGLRRREERRRRRAVPGGARGQRSRRRVRRRHRQRLRPHRRLQRDERLRDGPPGMACGDTSCMGNTLSPRPRCNGSGDLREAPGRVLPGQLQLRQRHRLQGQLRVRRRLRGRDVL